MLAVGRVRGATPLARLSLVHAVLLAAAGAYTPFLTLHLIGRGWDGVSIGGALTSIALVRLVAAPLVGVLADRLRRDDRLFAGMTAIAAVGVTGVALTTEPALTGLCMLVVASVRAPSSIVLDAATVRTLREQQQPASRYGNIRLWGSVGYLIAAAGVSLALASTPVVALLMAAALLLLASALGPFLGTGDASPRAALGPALVALAGDRVLVILLVAGTLHGASLHVFDAWFPALLAAQGHAMSWTAVALALAIGAEVAAMASTVWLRARLDLTSLLVLSGALGGVRLLVSALAPSLAVVLAVQALHGVAVGVWWVAIVEATAERAPAQLRASVQAVLVSAAYGAGPALSGCLSAWLVRDADPTPLFVAAGCAAFVGAAVSAIATARPPATPATA